jgi:hypothetical protein
MPVLVPMHEQPQVGSSIFQAPAPLSDSTRLTCVLTADRAMCPANHRTVGQRPLQKWKLGLGDAMPVLMPIYEQLQMSPNFFQAPAPPSQSTCLTCVQTGQSHVPSESSNCCSLHAPNMDASMGKIVEPCAQQIIQPSLTAPVKHGG